MASMQEVREALKVRIDLLMAQIGKDWTVYSFVPDAINAPAVYIDPDRPFIDYQQAFREGQACWRFCLTPLVNRIDDESAQSALGLVMDPQGPLVQGLQGYDVDGGELEPDALTEIAAYVEVISATRYGAYRIGRSSYYGLQIMIEVRT